MSHRLSDKSNNNGGNNSSSSLRKKEDGRKKMYKTGVNVDEARRRREDQFVVIRKNKRDESLTKKRREILTATDSSSSFPQALMPPEHSRQFAFQHTESFQLESLPNLVQRVWSDDAAIQLEATIHFRRILSVERNPPIDEVIKAGVVPRFVQFLSMQDRPRLQFEAAWALTNVASGTSADTQVVIDHGAVPMFVELLRSPHDDIREQVVWALGNVAGDSPMFRDFVLTHGALMPLLSLINERSNISLLRNATWALSNFCKGKPPAPTEQIKHALPFLQQLIHSADEEILADACWTLSHLSNGATERIQDVIDAGVCPRLMELVLHPQPSIFAPALRAVGNIVTGDDVQTQFMIDNGLLPRLFSLLRQNHKKRVKEEACWAISNITAGNKEQIQAIIDADIIHPLIQLLEHAEFDIKKEVAWALSNAIAGGTSEQIRVLVSQGCIKPLCDLLACSDPKIVLVCLEGIEKLLKVGEAEKDLGNGGVNIYAQMIDDCEGLDKIENLQSHDNNDIYVKTIKILERYWVEEEDEVQDVIAGSDLELVAPAVDYKLI